MKHSSDHRNSQAIQSEPLDDLRNLFKALSIQPFHPALHLDIIQVVHIRIDLGTGLCQNQECLTLE
jgi:hypothetical protein